MTVLVLFGVSSLAFAMEDGDPIKVTFQVNTSTVADTLSADGVLQIRGNVNGSEFNEMDYFGQTVNWGSGSTLLGDNVGGDYWEIEVMMAPGDVLTYKFWAGHDLDTGAGFNDGWEFNFEGEGNDYVFEVPADATEDLVVDLQYFAGTSDGRTKPFEVPEGFKAVQFRVNVGNAVSTNQFDPEDESQFIGVRGEVQEDGRTIHYKYVIETEGADPGWEGDVGPAGGNRRGFIAADSDTTLGWSFFNNAAPPEGDIVTAELTFRANVGLLEGLGFFNRAVGDEVFSPGAFNSWDTGSQPMSYDELNDVWVANYELTREVGDEVPYKYFIRWDESRFDEDSPNFIPGLRQDGDNNNGWEEPGSTGGGDRLYTFGSEAEQDVTGDFGSDIGFFNSLPEQAIITVDGVGAETLPVTFQIDMTNALSHSTPFNPEEDEVFMVIETPFFGLTQGIPVGDNQPSLDDPEARERVKFTPTGEGNMYELTLELNLPTENHIGFTIAYEDPDGARIINGGGTQPGRRYYRYIDPVDVLEDFTIWPEEFTVEPLEWVFEDLDFPAPPTYGIDDVMFSPVLFGSGENLDWGSSIRLTREEQPDTRNHFYSGVLLIPIEGTSIEDPRFGENPQQIALSQNYPNPFNPTTNITFALPENINVRLDVYNILGQRVATLADGMYNAGTHTVQFDASRLSSGVYLYRLQAGNFTTNKTMMLVK